MTITGNTLTGAYGDAISIIAGGTRNAPEPVDLAATISGNTIGNSAIDASGSRIGDGIGLSVSGGATARALILNNSISQWDFSAILASNTNTDGTLDLTVAGNSLSSPDSSGNPYFGFSLQSGLGGTGDQASTCLDIGGALSLSNSLTGSGANGASDIRVRASSTLPIRVPGLTTATPAGAAAYIQGRNSPGNTTNASAGNSGGYADTTPAGASCLQP